MRMKLPCLVGLFFLSGINSAAFSDSESLLACWKQCKESFQTLKVPYSANCPPQGAPRAPNLIKNSSCPGQTVYQLGAGAGPSQPMPNQDGQTDCVCTAAFLGQYSPGPWVFSTSATPPIFNGKWSPTNSQSFELTFCPSPCQDQDYK